MTLRVLDLFSGLGGATAAFEDRGHDVVTVDIEEAFEPTICKNILHVTAEELAEHGPYDFIWASPPCKTLTKIAAKWYWKDGRPSSPRTYEGIAIVAKTLSLMFELDPRAWIMENPVGRMRTLGFLQHLERRTVTYCQYGMPYRKATDLFGGFPSGFEALSCKQGASCHEPTPSKNGHGIYRIQHDIMDAGNREQEQKKKTGGVALHGGKLKAAKRSLVPYNLSLQVCKAMEQFNKHWKDAAPRITDYL